MSIDATRDDGTPRPNTEAIRLRKAKGWSQARLAREFAAIAQRRGWVIPEPDTVKKQISRIESGRTQLPEALYRQLWCDALGVDVNVLFGLTPAVAGAPIAPFKVTSHKFIPAFLSRRAMCSLHANLDLVPAPGQWWDGCLTATIPGHPHLELFLWPWQVAVVHVREDLALKSITQLALHRRSSYPQARSQVDSVLTELTGTAVHSAYTFSAYWVADHQWDAERLDSAIRLLSMPSQLLNREDDGADEQTLQKGGEEAEGTLLRAGGVYREDLTGFGVSGVSVAYASWSSVAYHPLAHRKAIHPDDLLACQLLTQGLWCYTAEILRQVEQGDDPEVGDGYGWRFLRAVRSRLTAARPTETGQVRSMRSAILLTSGLTDQLDAAMAVLPAETGG
jgi:transcriptional regulator with XRE-family HTH domain